MVPEKYIDQLIEDLASATKEDNNKTETFNPTFEDILSNNDFDDENTDIGLHPFSYHTGITREVFPPKEMLTNAQKLHLIDAIGDLLYSFHITCDYPSEISVDLEYDLMVSVFDREIEIVDMGIVTLEFCDYNPRNCLFGKNCNCMSDYWEEELDLAEESKIDHFIDKAFENEDEGIEEEWSRLDEEENDEDFFMDEEEFPF